MHTVVRRATEADAEALIELRRKLFAETTFMLWEPAEFTSTSDHERHRIARLNGQANSVVLIAESGGQAAGLLTAVGGERKRQQHAVHLALGVAKAWWGQGIATRMLQDALAWSREVGVKRVELTVHTANLRAISVYLRCGFQVEGVRRSSLLVEGAYADEYLMSVLHGG